MANRRHFSVEKAGRPASLTDDVFEYAHRIPGIVELLEQCALPFTIAVEGEWGRGKSSLLNMLIEHVEQRREPARNWTVVRYHPWRYDIHTFDDAWESLVEVIDRQVSGRHIEDRIGSLSQRVAEHRLARLIWRLGIPAAGLLVPGGAAIAEGASALGEQIKHYLGNRDQLGPGYMIFERVREQLVKLARTRLLLIVIDDLDRCAPVAVSQVLRCVATLFAPAGAGPRVAFLLALDRRSTVRALMEAEHWEEDYASQYLEKLIHVHVTLPIVGIGAGDREANAATLVSAIQGAGHRKSRLVRFPGKRELKARFVLPEDRVDAVVRFLQYNPRRIERFCILFDLKWASRFEANARVAVQRPKGALKGDEAQTWLNRFRDRLIWEAVIELRWPLYDAKTSAIDQNKQAILETLAGKGGESRGLPCAPFLGDPDFLAVHDLYFNHWSRLSPPPPPSSASRSQPGQ